MSKRDVRAGDIRLGSGGVGGGVVLVVQLHYKELGHVGVVAAHGESPFVRQEEGDLVVLGLPRPRPCPQQRVRSVDPRQSEILRRKIDF